MDRIYRIGGHCFRVSGERLTGAVAGINGFGPFAWRQDAVPAFTVAREEGGGTFPAFKRKSYAFEYDGVNGTFGAGEEGFLLELAPQGGQPLCLRTVDEPGAGRGVRLYGNDSPRLLRFALWMGYGLMTVGEDTAALHGSCIVHREKAFLFLGESGTGKSTHTRLWREHIAGSRLLNDDSPIVRHEEGSVWVYGSPWSGKTPCYKAERYPLAGCVRLSQAPCNRMRRLGVVQAYAALHPSAPPAFAYEEALYGGVCSLLEKIVSSVPVYHLACLPDAEAAGLACRTLFGGRE